MHKVYEIENLSNGRFISATNERPDKFMNRKFSEGCKFVNLIVVKEGVREYLILDEPEKDTRSSDSELIEYVGRVKEALKAKTGWGRNEVIKILEGNLDSKSKYGSVTYAVASSDDELGF